MIFRKQQNKSEFIKYCVKPVTMTHAIFMRTKLTFHLILFTAATRTVTVQRRRHSTVCTVYVWFCYSAEPSSLYKH